MKYKTKIEKTISIEIKAGDVFEWRNGEEKLAFVVTKTTNKLVAGLCFRDNRKLGKMPHLVKFHAVNSMLGYGERLRKMEAEEWE